MEEVLKAFEAAVRRIVQEEMKAKSNAFDFIDFIDRNADKFDRAVMDGLENSERMKYLVERHTYTDKEAVEEIIEKYDFDDKMVEAARKLTFTTEVSQY